MKTKLGIWMFALAAVGFMGAGWVKAEGGKSYELKLKYEDQKISLIEASARGVAADDKRLREEKGWGCEVIGVDGKKLDSFKFVIPLVVCKDEAANEALAGGCVDNNGAEFSLRIPYYAKGAAINITDPKGVAALTVSVMEFAELCGDGICEANENRMICGQDCRSGVKDGVCDGETDGTCDGDCKNGLGEDPDCEGVISNLEKANMDVYLLVVMIMIVLGLAGVSIWEGRK